MGEKSVRLGVRVWTTKKRATSNLPARAYRIDGEQ